MSLFQVKSMLVTEATGSVGPVFESKCADISVAVAIARAHEAEPALHAWTQLAEPTSLAPVDSGALQGWPLAVKDNMDVRGFPTRCGSPVSDPRAKVQDASVVAQLRAAGAVPIGKTVTTEFAYVTAGPTRNPWHLGHTPGGSSSGSAAAVASGLVPIALGTQTGGSMIRPAAFCGVVGFKPSYGTVSREGMHLGSESLDVIGWFGRSVEHAHAVARVLLPARSESPRHLDGAHVFWLDANPGHVLQPDAAAALSSAAALITEHTHLVRRTKEFAGHAELLNAHATLMHYEFARSLQATVMADDGLLSGPLLKAVRRGWAVDGDTYVAARRLQAKAQLSWEASFGDADFVLTSSAVGTAPAGLQYTGDSAFNKGWSVLGWPCIHLPTTFAANGLPLGVLLVARPYADLDLLTWAGQIHAVIDQRGNAKCTPIQQPKAVS